MPVPQQGIITTVQAQSKTLIQEKLNKDKSQKLLMIKNILQQVQQQSLEEISLCVHQHYIKSDYSANRGNRAIDSSNKGHYISCSVLALFSLGKLIFLNFPLNLQ